ELGSFAAERSREAGISTGGKCPALSAEHANLRAAVRTTLKRGIGRGAAVNGNGHGVLPPNAIEPMRRYRQPDPPRRSTKRLLMQVLGWILLALVVVVAGLA